ncbi:sigma-54-dependent transcriptional regulator [Alteribacter natronophilus]|uniref:sigma-54-dependent transcriptional regulator n=1 Tax=Alteribacter natronophilus TaxID=2583810 RepID=UPI00110E9540|nr:sigma-54 dependent transcriptional regulator [Alteribacter natronophilus]TMW70422.1 sigma-54-dependent Fis family transcriptional regulator [Alteribacter natronophilus]
MDTSILLIEDNEKLRRLMKLTLEKEGYRVEEAPDGKTARSLFSEDNFDIVLSDILLPDTTGIKLLEEWKESDPGVCCILCTAYGEVEDAVQAMKLGAFDYLTKPIKADELKVVIRRAIEWVRLNEENEYLREVFADERQLHGMAGVSEKMKRVFDMVHKVAGQPITVLLQGESGTGKSRCAQAIHLESDRKGKPYIEVNCAAIPDQLLESELFGYAKGAFTGAVKSQKGKFEAADGGTLFLDEIAEISPGLQAKLLQVTQDKTFYPLGSSDQKKVDVRLIAATNRDLWEMVQEGTFREDLYYRLNIIGINIPSLRERSEDLPLLIEQLTDEIGREHSTSYELEPGLMKKLSCYTWPGNIRELYNAIARAAVLAEGTVLKLEDFPKEVRENAGSKEESPEEKGGNEAVSSPGAPLGDDFSLTDELENYEQSTIEEALRRTGGNQAQAADLLGISRQSLLYKIRKYGI